MTSQKIAQQKEVSPEKVSTFEKAVDWRRCSLFYRDPKSTGDELVNDLVKEWQQDYRCWNLRKQYDNLFHFEEEKPDEEPDEDTLKKMEEIGMKMHLERCR